jgi:hypothetical protein
MPITKHGSGTTEGGVSTPIDDSYIRSTPTSIAVGGAPIGTTFNGTIAAALDKILYPYLAPAFTSFSINVSTILEVGNSIVSGVKNFTWGTSRSENVAPNTVTIIDTTNNVVLASLIANDSTESISTNTITKNTPTSNIWTISAKDIKNTTISRTFAVNWYWAVFYGESALTTLTEADVKALRAKELLSSPNKTYNLEAGNYKWICYPVSLGLKTVFKDADTLFDVAMVDPITVSVTNDYGVTTDYYCHRTFNTLGGTIRITMS